MVRENDDPNPSKSQTEKPQATTVNNASRTSEAKSLVRTLLSQRTRIPCCLPERSLDSPHRGAAASAGARMVMSDELVATWLDRGCVGPRRKMRAAAKTWTTGGARCTEKDATRSRTPPQELHRGKKIIARRGDLPFAAPRFSLPCRRSAMRAVAQRPAGSTLRR
jgi:hypothetical protein